MFEREQVSEEEILDQEPGEQVEEGGETEQSGEGDKSAGEQPTVEQLQESLRLAEARAEQSQRLLSQMQERLFEREERSPRKEEEEEEQPETDELESLTEEQMSSMTNKQLAQLSARLGAQAAVKAISKTLMPKIEERLSNLGSTVEEERARRDVATAAAKYQDFWTHKATMVALSQEPKYRSLGAEDLYLLAKARSGAGAGPTNVNKGKVTNPTDAQRRAARASGEKPVTMGGGTGGAKKGEMSPEEAADDAWNKVFGNKK